MFLIFRKSVVEQSLFLPTARQHSHGRFIGMIIKGINYPPTQQEISVTILRATLGLVSMYCFRRADLQQVEPSNELSDNGVVSAVACFYLWNTTRKKHQPHLLPETKTKNVFRSHQQLVSSAVIVKTRFIELQQTPAHKRAENYRKTERKTKQFWIPGIVHPNPGQRQRRFGVSIQHLTTSTTTQ